MIAIASDHGGYDLKERVKKYLEEKNIPYQDMGCDSKASCDYPVFGHAAARAVADGTCEKGIVICTTAQTDEEARELLTLVGAPFER